MVKHRFYNGGKIKFLKSHFWPEKFTNIGPEYIKRCGIATFGGVGFIRKVDFLDIFMRKSGFCILAFIMELHYKR